ncbi:Sulfide:quinone oxidoreductase, Type I [hydrothermal vent metagenome]|uniref:Sulfide:quinone oxidoreductase, Type I n=1 Tax=hydrothermal vent metagenome TaxID=652676 RepID=A0A3B0R7M3_9ZZZZ
MAHIVILGAGLGGVPMALEMRNKARSEDKITVINNRDTFDFTPSNPWVAVDWRKPGDIRVALPKMFKKKNIDFVLGTISKVDPAAKTIGLEDGGAIAYDYLVIATGPDLAFDEIKGFGPDANTVSICSTDHAAHAREKWLEFVEKPGPIVVGAAQGASCYGPAYEFAMLMDTDLRKRKIRDKVPMTYITAEPWIGHLGLGGVGDTKGMLESEFRSRHINWICNAKITKITKDTVEVEELNEDGSIKATHQLPFAHSMILPAFRGIPPLMGVEGLVNPRGFVTVDQHQRNKTYPEVFSVGVCIAIAPVGATPVPVGVPKTGFMIESMVRATAYNIRALIDGKEPKHEATWNAVCLADFGDGGVAFIARPQIPPRNVNWASQGKWVHYGKVAFEKFFLSKVKRGVAESFFEKLTLDLLGITKSK